LYRPISLTSVCCKIFEKIITQDIMQYLETNQILCSKQHGFRNQRSCETQLLGLIHELSEQLDSGKQVDLIFLDFAKAFDTVPHKRLISKLQHYKLNPLLINWIANYLSERSHRVVLNGEFSETESVLSGVPQGSVLGPLLFLLYINDLPESILSSLRLFADDGLLSKVITSASDAIVLQNDLKSCESWAEKWLLKYNVGKCETMRITRKRLPIVTDYLLNSQVLNVTEQYKYLGIQLDSKLNPNTQAAAAAKKAMNMLYFIHRNLKKSTPFVRERAYNVFVRPILEYAVTAWDPYTDSGIHSLERVQRKAIRIVLQNFDRAGTSTDELLKEHNWLSLSDRRKIIRLTNLHKCKSGYPGLQELKENLYPPHYLSSRVDHQYKIREINARTDQFKYSFLPRTVRDWNGLPQHLFESFVNEDSVSTPQFRNRIASYYKQL
jgi:ribonucleases P/MRP protein subunit RPP40